MKQFEVTFIVDPVLSGDEIKATAQTYTDLLKKEGCTIVHEDEMGLRQLAYPIKRRNTGMYYCIEFQCESGEFIKQMELAFRRDERIMRFLTIKLDKYGIKYNDDKRNGKIGKVKKKEKKDPKDGVRDLRNKNNGKPKGTPKQAPAAKPAPKPVPAATTVAAPAAPAVAMSITADEEE